MAVRVLNRCVDYYRTGVAQFVNFGLGPPPSAVRSGELSIPEAMPLLLDLHKSCMTRLGNDTTGVLRKAVRKLGPVAVDETLTAELASIYGVPAEEIHRAQAMAEAGPEIFEGGQPLVGQDFDLTALRPECEEVLRRSVPDIGHELAEAFGTIGDPRLPRRQSLVGVVPGGLAWASMMRPHEVETLRFDELRLISDPSQPTFDFADWRRRSFRPETHASWQVIDPAIREESAKAGLVWSSFEGKRPNA